MLLLGYLAAGAIMIWPRPTYLTGKLPATLDQASYVWGFWWVAHQLVHLANPWYTSYLAAPAGVQLGFDTLMPLPGVLLAPVTLTLGPAFSYNLLTIVLPGLSCYAMYRAARLWLNSQAGAIAAGAFYGLATMLVWQDWYHLNISAGALFLPLTLEASVRLRRRPSRGRAVLTGVILGASLLVNQESAIMAGILAICVLLPWLVSAPSLAKLRVTGLAVVATLAVSAPQIVAMAQQLIHGGAAIGSGLLAGQDAFYGTPPVSLFAPTVRLATFGLPTVGRLFEQIHPSEGAPSYGVSLTVLAIIGLAAGWRRRSTRQLTLLWAGATALALGTSLVMAQHVRLVPLAAVFHGVHMSLLLPYTWLVQIPELSGFREADRFTLLGLVPAAMLAGNGLVWLARRSKPLLLAAIALALLEVGYAGNPAIGTMPAAMPRLDGPIAADHSGSIVVDIPFGLRGGVSLYGKRISRRALVLATADGHPRGESYTSWVPPSTRRKIHSHVFYRRLVDAQIGRRSTATELRAAHADARAMGIGWAMVWEYNAATVQYLRGAGFRFAYQVDHVTVYRLAPSAGPVTAGSAASGGA